MFDIYSFTMIISIASFTLATVLTPGPNNIMLLSSGLTFGYKRTLPHMMGIMFGFPLMVVGVGLGVGAIFELFPVVFILLKVVGIAYLFWMAWHIANSKGGFDTKENDESNPFTFIQAAAFQWVNPKAWIMAITATATFTTDTSIALQQVMMIAFIYLLSGVISTNSWAMGGVVLKKLIKNDRSIKIFNISMAVLIVVSVLPFIFE